MAQIKELLYRVETRVALAQGLDVQIHAEERIIEIIRHKYNSVFDQMWWDDYMNLGTFQLDGTTGVVVEDLTNLIRRFHDIHSVFLENDDQPLPVASRAFNPNNIRRPSIISNSDVTKVFKVVPTDTTGPVYVWYRTVLPDSVWTDGAYETEVNMDAELIITGSCYDFLIDDGTNQAAADKFKALFDGRYKQLSGLEHHHNISKSSQGSSIPNDWYVDS